MTGSALAPVPSTAARTLFWITAVPAFVGILTILVIFPRGATTEEGVRGDEVSVELGDGVTAAFVPEIRDLGWRAEHVTRPYEISVHLTIDNASEDLFPRGYRIALYDADHLVDGEDLSARLTNTLQTSFIEPGGQAATDFVFAYDRPCDELVARISFVPSVDRSDESISTDVPFSVGDSHCLAQG